MIILPPAEKIVRLNTDEISEIIDTLNRVQHDVFVVMNYQKIIDKLKEAGLRKM